MKKIIEQIAKEKNIRPIIVEAIIRSQFGFVRDVMEEGQFKSVLLPYLGKFAVKKERLKYLEERYGRREEKTEQDTEN